MACAAPVNAPRSWPNSSLSSSASDSAAQLMATSGRAARGEAAWMARASTSLPTPVSPRISTLIVAGGGAFGERLHPPHVLVGAGEASVGVGVLAFAARARAGAGEQGRRVAAVIGIAGDADARRGPAPGSRLRERCRQHARGVAGEPGQKQLVFAGTEQADHVDRASGQGGDVLLAVQDARVRRRPHARDGERPSGCLGARALPLHAPLELGVRKRPRPRRRPRWSIGLHHEHERADRDRLAGENAHPRPRRQLAFVEARAVRAAQVFDLDVVRLVLPDVQPEVAAGCFRVIQLHVDAGPAAAPDDQLAARGQGERRELLRSHDQQVKAGRRAGPVWLRCVGSSSSVLGVATLYCNATRGRPSPAGLRAAPLPLRASPRSPPREGEGGEAASACRGPWRR